MRTRAYLIALTMTAVVTVGGCTGSSMSIPQSERTTPAATSAATAENSSSAAINSADTGSADPGAGDSSSAEPSAGDLTADPTTEQTDGGSAGKASDPRGLAALPYEKVCALLPKAQAEKLTGKTLADGDGSMIADLGTNCVYSEPSELATTLKIEFSTFSYETSAQLLAYQPDDSVPAPTDCTVSGRTALCQEPFDISGIRTGAQVLVQIDGAGDVALLVEAPDAGIAMSVAEAVVANLG